ncbi:MAG: 1-deoxy-D-xylulose-5-phosphate reductoisomerase [Alloprevotella sp.]
MKHIAILGSTGSIGTQALDVVRHHPDQFEATVLTAGSNADLLIKQAIEFVPNAVVIANEAHYETVRDALAHLPIKVYAGDEAICQVVQMDSVDLVLTAIVGFAGLRSTVAAIQAGKSLALANKETLVVAGSIIRQLCQQHKVSVLPVDSEHSAIFQCLNGEGDNAISRILLTASGGPFNRFTIDQLERVTPQEALRHPNWNMGAKITIDSATLMNKGFEMIEAYWLYQVPPEQIQVVVHPESIVHSAVEFMDGTVMAQMGLPDMRLPIQYAFSYPRRLSLPGPKLHLFDLQCLHFERPDMERFPCLQLAYDAIAKGGNMPCILNAAGEVCNQAFRQGIIGFMDIARITAHIMQQATYIESPTLDDLFATDAETRRLTDLRIAPF